ncbi:hypothetical protein DBR06_SOUSAS5210066, partial [Sousa chinensis]
FNEEESLLSLPGKLVPAQSELPVNSQCEPGPVVSNPGNWKGVRFLRPAVNSTDTGLDLV